MLDKLIKTGVKREAALYLIGRTLGIFPENSFKQYSHIFDPEALDNEVSKMLSSFLTDLTRMGALYTAKEDIIKWNTDFKVDSVLESIEKKKQDRERLAQKMMKIKQQLRKLIITGKIINNCIPEGLILTISTVDFNVIAISTLVTQNTNWENVFEVGAKVLWKFNDSHDDVLVFSMKSISQDVFMYVSNDGKIEIEKEDS